MYLNNWPIFNYPNSEWFKQRSIGRNQWLTGMVTIHSNDYIATLKPSIIIIVLLKGGAFATQTAPPPEAASRHIFTGAFRFTWNVTADRSAFHRQCHNEWTLSNGTLEQHMLAIHKRKIGHYTRWEQSCNHNKRLLSSSYKVSPTFDSHASAYFYNDNYAFTQNPSA